MRPRMTHLACIIGWPVAQSLSPVMHNAAFAARNLDWTYVPLAVQPGAAAEGVELLRTLGVDGANVTVPHKVAIVTLLDAVQGDAAVFGAVNTIVRDGERLIGHNTDGEGFLNFLRADAGFDPSDTRAVVLGAGGAARAVAIALARAGAHVTVSARRDEEAHALAEAAEGIATASWGKADPADLVVNATSSRDKLPAPAARLAVDLIYLPPETGFQSAALRSGARVFDGLGMLVHQAALSFQMWTGGDAPLEVMRKAAERGISEQTGTA